MKATVLLLLFGGALVYGCERDRQITQPIQFSHRAHTEKGLSCDLCHESIEKAASAGLPAIETCMTCHQAAMSDSPEEAKVRQYGEQGQEIPWRRLFELPAHVYFSHRRHVAFGGVACAECHGNMGENDAPSVRPAVALSMGTCMGCHAQRNASGDCDACHR